jgi:hypothetical protein
MARIIVSGSIVIPSGPQFAFNRPLDVDVYGEIDVTIASGANNKEVDLPVNNKPVQLIAIMSDWYSDELTYKINSTGAANTYRLNQPLLLFGEDAVTLFSNALTALFFSNTPAAGETPKDAKLQILIGCHAN